MSKFKLTPEDIALLREWGETEERCIKQVERCAAKKYTKYTMIDTSNGIGVKKKSISREEAIEILGREEWLSGLHRSAFHCSAVRYKGGGCEGQIYVHFDSYDFFRF